MISPRDFYENTLGKVYELDGVPVSDPIQCADFFKKACLDVLGYHWPTGGDGYVDYFWYGRKEHASEIREITDWRQFQNGDFVIWGHSKRDQNSPFPTSHIAMFWQKSDGKKYMVGENQPYKYVTEKEEPDDVWSRALGALRFKSWDTNTIDLPYGLIKDVYKNITINVVRAPKANGYDLHMITAPGEYAVQDIDAFDADNLIILAGVNANYFQLSDGRHLGDEGDGTVMGYQQIVPLQSGWLAYFQKDGETACWDTTSYYYDQKDVDFVCTPYAVRLFHGKTTYLRSANCGDKDDTKNTQTAALRFANGDWAVAIFTDCYPREVYEWAVRIRGIQDVILMDSGGSTQMFECTSGVRKIVKKTTRKVSSALVLAKPMTADFVPYTPDAKETAEKNNDDSGIGTWDTSRIEALLKENNALKEKLEHIHSVSDLKTENK